jgi:alkylation response protein AidB-like acyl-CoA dehydrogenase
MTTNEGTQTMKMLPGDEIRQIMWRYAERYDMQMAVMGSRSVARGLVARLVANGERNTHEWTEAKNELYKAFDDSGITAAVWIPRAEGSSRDPGTRRWPSSLSNWRGWTAARATTSLINNLALGPIIGKAPEQREKYMRACLPVAPAKTAKSGAARSR